MFARLLGIRAVLKHEHLATRRGDLAQEAGHDGIPQFSVLGLGTAAYYNFYGEPRSVMLALSGNYWNPFRN